MTRGRVPDDLRPGFALLAALLLTLWSGCAGTAVPSPAVSDTPTTSPSPTGVPSPSASNTAAAPSPTSGVPSDFAPRSVTFVSASESWVLGSTVCGAELCPVIVHSVDGGGTWARVDAPATTVSTAPRLADATIGVAQIRFADRHNGWVFGPELWATHDGGLTWNRLTLPAPLASVPVIALETEAGHVHAVALAVEAAAGPGFRIASSPIDEDAWQVAPVTVEIGGGPVTQAELVLAGSAGWVLVVNRVVIDGARIEDGVWHSWLPPCAGSVGPAALAAWSETGLLAVCDVGLWADPAGEHLLVSTDGGDTFVERNAAMPLDSADLAAASTSSAFFVKGVISDGNVLVASSDGGHSWTTVLETGATARAGYLGFMTETQGVFIDDTGLFMTRDGGHTWREVSF